MFNPTMTTHGLIYSYLDAMVPPSTLAPCFFSVYFHGTDYEVQGNIQRATIPILKSKHSHQLTNLSHECNP